MRKFLLIIFLVTSILAWSQTEHDSVYVQQQIEKIDILDSLAIISFKNRNYNEAIKLYGESLSITEKFFGKEHSDYAGILNNLASCYYFLNNYSEALRLCTEALHITKKTLDKEHPLYATIHRNIANCFYKLDNYSEAIPLFTEVIQITEKTLGKEHPDYVYGLNKLALCNDGLGNYSEAIQLYTEALQITEKTQGKEHPHYASSLYNLASCYSELGNYNEAIRLYTEALQITEKTLGKEHPDYVASLDDLGKCHYNLGNYNEAIRLYTEALKIEEKTLGKEHPDYAYSLFCLANCYRDLGNYSEAVRLDTKSLLIIEKSLGKEHPDYGRSLNNLALCYDRLGNYSEAIRLFTEALQIKDKTLGKDHPDYAGSLINLADCYYKVDNFNEAIRLLSEALRRTEKTLGKEHPLYALSLMGLANCYRGIGNYSEAVRLDTESLLIKEKSLGKEHPDYGRSLNNLANDYKDLGNYSEAISLYSEALQIKEKTLGKKHPDYARSLNNIALCYENIDLNEFYLRKKEYLDLKTTILIDAVQGLSTADRETLWENENYTFDTHFPQNAFQYNNDILNGCAYDASLLSKGFLLGAETETKKLILESEDAALVAKYDEMVMTRRMLDKLLEKPLNERHMDADSLRNVITNLERDVMAGSRAYGNLKKNMSIKWQDVQGKLGKGDIAVEFLSFPVSEDSIMYVAFTLNEGYKSPKQIPLFEEKQLKALGKDVYSGDRLYNLVWKPLEEELKGAKNVYFSPSGELYNINIEVLPGMEGNDKGRNYWRLSSTRQLAYIRDDKTSQGATVYGGMLYSASRDVIEANSKKYPRRNRSWDDGLTSIDDVDGPQGGWGYLTGTLTEATSVGKTIEKSNIKTELLVDTAATEASFKALDGAGRKYMHIATHGFYYTEHDTVEMKHAGLGFTLLGEDRVRGPKYVEDKSLTRSGLLFSGCNYRLMGKELPEGVEDGILFAKEIANLDLRGMDLVTLSACETGLGDITGEGVFGLQRAFKKAGAQSILMSLWKVDDAATQLFMTRFYENYLSKKMTKSDALKDAQHYLRTFDGGRYKDPVYWAAFILLDPDIK